MVKSGARGALKDLSLDQQALISQWACALVAQKLVQWVTRYHWHISYRSLFQHLYADFWRGRSLNLSHSCPERPYSLPMCRRSKLAFEAWCPR